MTSEAVTKLSPAKRSGEYPSRTAPFSFSAAARVARPNVVNLDQPHSTMPITITITASQRPSRGTVRSPAIVTGWRGRMGSTRIVVLSANRRSTSDMKTIVNPTLATTLASAGAARSGRNTSR